MIYSSSLNAQPYAIHSLAVEEFAGFYVILILFSNGKKYSTMPTKIIPSEIAYFLILCTYNNADLYAANQGNTDLINEVYTEEAPLRFMGQDVFHHQPLSLD